MRRITEIMTRRPAVVGADAPLTEALAVMGDRGISSVLVLRPGFSAYGIITMRDVVSKVVRHGLDPRGLRAADIATWRVLTAAPTWTVQEAAAAMADAGIRRLPVVEGEELAGIVSDTDLFVALVPGGNWEQARAVRKERAARRGRGPEPARAVQDLMSSPVLSTDPEVTVQRAVGTMVAAGVSSLLVGTTRETPTGIVTKRDVVTKVVARGRPPAEVKVAEIMSDPVRIIEAGAALEACSARMADDRVRRLPVVLAGQIVGIVSDSDLLAAVIGDRWRGHRRLRVPASAIVADVMQHGTRRPVSLSQPTLSPELSIWQAAERLARAGASHLAVVQDGAVIGTVHQTDILQALEERGAPD